MEIPWNCHIDGENKLWFPMKKKQWIFVGKIWFSKTTMSQLLVTGTHLVLRSFLQGGSRIGDRGSDSTGGT
jgi:hypothetical protein